MSKKTLNGRSEEKADKGLSIVPLVILGVLLVGGLGFLFSNNNLSVTGLVSASIGTVHWHADAKFSVCGEKRFLPRPQSDIHLGTELMHTHQDGRMHIEGFVGSPSDITLQKFLRIVGINFTDTQLFEKKNGDLCNGVPGKVSLTVNGLPNDQLANYSIKAGDRFEIVFE